MPWIVGIDEAGYGPNLGPLVMTAAAVRIPTALGRANLWKVLEPVVRKQDGADDDRLVIDDSKLVYSPTKTIAALERSVLSTLQAWRHCLEQELSQLLDGLAPNCVSALAEEVWYE